MQEAELRAVEKGNGEDGKYKRGWGEGERMERACEGRDVGARKGWTGWDGKEVAGSRVWS